MGFEKGGIDSEAGFYDTQDGIFGVTKFVLIPQFADFFFRRIVRQGGGFYAIPALIFAFAVVLFSRVWIFLPLSVFYTKQKSLVSLNSIADIPLKRIGSAKLNLSSRGRREKIKIPKMEYKKKIHKSLGGRVTKLP